MERHPGRRDEKNIAEDVLYSVRGLYDLLAEIRDIDRQWFCRQFKLGHRHDSPLSMLDELEELLREAMADLNEKPSW